MSGFKCLECGKRFRTVAAAQRASNDGCPKCGGVDIDLDVETAKEPVREARGRINALDGTDQPETHAQRCNRLLTRVMALDAC